MSNALALSTTRSLRLPMLPEPVTAALEPCRMSEYGPVRCDEAQATGFRIRPGRSLQQAEAEQAIGALRHWLDQRLTMDEALAALADLRRVCASGKDWVDTPEHFEAYAKRCVTMPAAAVLRAIAEWPNTGERGRWMPQWADLLRAIEREEDPVRRRLGALQRVATGKPSSQRSGGIVAQLTPEQQAERKAHSKRVMAEFREKQAGIQVDKILEGALPPDQMARIDASRARAREAMDAQGHAANKRRVGMPERVENPVDDEREYGT